MKTTESTSIFSAIISDDLSLVKKLLKENPDIANEVHDILKITPLELAIGGNSENTFFIIKSLLESGGNLKKRSSVLHIAVECCCTPDVIHLLVSHGAKVDAKEGDLEQTPLHVAVKNGNNDVALALVECGADIYIENKEGITPLDLTDKKLREQLNQYFEDHIKLTTISFGKEIMTPINGDKKSGIESSHSSKINNSGFSQKISFGG